MSYSPKVTYFIRNFHFKNFLIKNILEIDRVILVDLYDTIFQNDPFTTDFGNLIYFCDEGSIIGENKWNLKWVNEVFDTWQDYGINITISDELKKKILSKNILNCGTVAGSTKYIIEFTKIICKIGNEHTLKVNVVDQGFMNVLVYSGYFNDKLNYTILPKNNSLFSSVSIIARNIDKSSEIFVLGNISINNEFPAIIHQYDRTRKISLLVKSACANIYNFVDYTRY